MAHSEQNQTSDRNRVNKTDILRDFQVSFFAMSRLVTFPWTFLEKDLESNKSSDLISDILKQTCLHSLCRKFPPSVRYRKLFLSEIIRREAAGCDPLDELYDALAEVVGAEDTTECYKNYLLPSGDAVSLLENVALISEGTTGLVTWEAALYLAEWALDHQQAFTGRTVLELGSGVGLTGITICRSCSPNRYIFSDCHHKVLQKLRDNVQLNGLTEQTSPTVAVEEMDWTTVTEEQIEQIGADTVIAADVVYDPDVVESLVKLLSKILRCSSLDVPPEVLICSTIRNQETYSGLKQQLEKAGISHHVITEAVSHVFPYNRGSAIEMIKLYSDLQVNSRTQRHH
ncbi:protein-lysine N-methyltransferase EEF2KMT isoform X2 [Epinephelus fuscoguttatus]|uniref:protein-lysine N-methyltransferase EEF2KMT isoform X2 n=1 Tax=Epinephelus fuscoguttatus TaxID=293821 RepID=UPI0020D1AC22|nr:protein-lysine N-methyltransferase EEF2KMT isoform X2 [Epinephelus fuscoguttatus]